MITTSGWSNGGLQVTGITRFVTTDKTTYAQLESILFTGTGFTPGGSISSCISTGNVAGVGLCVGQQNADSGGNVGGSMLVGTDIPSGPQKFWVSDVSTSRDSNAVQLTITSAIFVLHVQSSPITRVLISLGSPPTPYMNTNFDITSTNSFSSGPFTAVSSVTVGGSTYLFDHWELDGVNMGANPLATVYVGAGYPSERTAVTVYALSSQITFETNPASPALIHWGSCSGSGYGDGQSIYSTDYGSVVACYVPSGYSLDSWSCSGGLACSGSSNPTAVTFTGSGTITLNLKTGSLSNPGSTELTVSASPSSMGAGASYTVSGMLMAAGVGLGGEQILLVFGNGNVVAVATQSDGSFSYMATAPVEAGVFDVEVFFLGDYSGGTQYLPSTATTTISVS